MIKTLRCLPMIPTDTSSNIQHMRCLGSLTLHNMLRCEIMWYCTKQNFDLWHNCTYWLLLDNLQEQNWLPDWLWNLTAISFQEEQQQQQQQKQVVRMAVVQCTNNYYQLTIPASIVLVRYLEFSFCWHGNVSYGSCTGTEETTSRWPSWGGAGLCNTCQSGGKERWASNTELVSVVWGYIPSVVSQNYFRSFARTPGTLRGL